MADCARDSAGGRAGVSGTEAAVDETEEGTAVEDDAPETDGAAAGMAAAAATVPRSQGFGGEGVAIVASGCGVSESRASATGTRQRSGSRLSHVKM